MYSLFRTGNPSSSSTLNLLPNPRKVHFHRHHLASYCLDSTLLEAAAPVGIASVPADRIDLVAVHTGLVAGRIVPGSVHMGCCHSSPRWKMAGRAGCRSTVEGGRSPVLGRESRKARDRRRGGWEVAIAGIEVVRPGPA